MGYILGLHNNTSFWSWVRRNGCYQGRFGYTFNGDKEILRNLHKDVFLDRGIRLRRDEIPGFPECDVHSIAYDMDKTDTQQITQVFFEMKAELEKLNKVAKTQKENKQINWLYNYEQDKSVNLLKFLCLWNLLKKQWRTE